MLRAEFHLPSITAEEATPERKAPICVKFEIPYFTVSGIQVQYLKIIEKSGYQALPWVRYITMAANISKVKSFRNLHSNIITLETLEKHVVLGLCRGETVLLSMHIVPIFISEILHHTMLNSRRLSIVTGSEIPAD
ncbi:Mu homology domain protein [Raphanus sativus]|nr:Mu homology domain protein [Raphanus sativus]